VGTAVQVPGIKDGVVRGKDWPAIAKWQTTNQFGSMSKAAAAKRLAEMLKNLDYLCELQAPADSGKASSNAPPKAVTVRCYRKATDKVRSHGLPPRIVMHEKWRCISKHHHSHRYHICVLC
jgi:hypothetical protein